MAQVVPSGGNVPLPMNTKFIVSDSEIVRFINFDVGRSILQPEHQKFIEDIFAEHLINVIDRSGFADKIMTIHPVGFASATGKSDKNEALSKSRAQAVGDAVKLAFDKKKGRSTLAKDVNVIVDAIARGDAAARAQLGSSANTLPANIIEKAQSGSRSVALSFLAQHRVVPEDKVVLCRQILNVSILKKTVFGSQALADELEKLKQKSFALAILVPVLGVTIDLFLSELKLAVKDLTKEVLGALEVSAPEIFLILKLVDFLVPSDIGEQYEFKDARGARSKYNYFGEQHRVTLDFFDVFAQLLSVAIWLKKLDGSLEKLERLSEVDAKKLKVAIETLEKMKAFGKNMKRLSAISKSIIDKLFGKDGPARKIFGDVIVDQLLSVVSAEKLEDATDFGQVDFRRDGLFDIGSFSGIARAEVHDLFIQPSVVLLEFAAEKNISLLGFQANVVLQRRWHFGVLIGAFEISNGTLVKVS